MHVLLNLQTAHPVSAVCLHIYSQNRYRSVPYEIKLSILIDIFSNSYDDLYLPDDISSETAKFSEVCVQIMSMVNFNTWVT